MPVPKPGVSGLPAARRRCQRRCWFEPASEALICERDLSPRVYTDDANHHPAEWRPPRLSRWGRFQDIDLSAQYSAECQLPPRHTRYEPDDGPAGSVLPLG